MHRLTVSGDDSVLGPKLSLIVQSPVTRKVLGVFAFEVAFSIAFHYGMSFSSACASPFWLPDSVLLCALLVSKPRNWWIFLLGALPLRLITPHVQGLPVWFLLATFANDSAKALLVAVALRRFIKNPRQLSTVDDFLIFCLFAVLLAPALSAFGGAASRATLNFDYWDSWQQWFRGDALAHLVLTPAILCWFVDAPRNLGLPPKHRRLEPALLGTGLLLAGYLAFRGEPKGLTFPDWRSTAPVLLMFWTAIRFGMRGASAAVVVVTCFATSAAVHRLGPFADESPARTAQLLQNFLFMSTLPLYVIAILTDQRTATERARRESEESFRVMADSAPVMMWLAGTDMLCCFFNRGWLEFTGRTMDQEMGNGWVEGVHPDDLQHCLQIYHDSFNARQPFEMEYRLKRNDGEYRWILDRGVPRSSPGGDFGGYVGTAIDITDRKRDEETRHEMIHISRLAVMGEFTAMVAHELSKPLGAILSNTEAAEALLACRILPVEELREILSDVRKDNLRARETIARIRSLVSKREMQLRPIDMNETVADALRLTRGDALRRRVQIYRELGTPLPAVRGDPVYLQQVVLNLILNGMDAVSANPEGERHVFVKTDLTEDGSVEVAIRDSGYGIDPEHLPRIFESFFTTKPDGLGIGLSIARSIVQLHGGRLRAEANKDGGGATFLFTVPVAEEWPVPQLAKSPRTSPTRKPSRDRKTNEQCL